MPQRYIELPDPVEIKDRRSGEILKDDKGVSVKVTFQEFFDKLMSNPKWSENYVNVKSADAILRAMEDAKDGVVVLAEEDWKKLEECVQNPKVFVVNAVGMGQVQNGYGYHPTIVSQLLPLADAIVRAADKPPTRNS